jgi:hypothetical protein
MRIISILFMTRTSLLDHLGERMRLDSGLVCGRMGRLMAKRKQILDAAHPKRPLITVCC